MANLADVDKAARQRGLELEIEQQRKLARMTQQEREEANKVQTGFFGKIADNVSSFLDDKWTDDFSAIPVVGPAARFTGETLQSSWDGTYALGSAAALGTNWGYWTRRPSDADFWADAYETNVGEAAAGSLEYYSSDNVLGGLGGMGYTPESMGKNIYDKNPTLNIANPAERKVAFTGRTDLNVTSGLVSGVYGWFTDPLILLGKAKKVATVGGKVAGIEFAGRKRTLLDKNGNVSEKVFKSIDTDADEAIQFYKSGTGRNSRIGVIGESIAQRDFESLRKLSYFKGIHRDTLASIGANIDNTEDAIVFAAAAAGSAKYQKILADTQAAADLALKKAAQNGANPNPYERAFLNTPRNSYLPVVLPNYLEEGVDAQKIIDDLARKDKDLEKALIQSGSITGKALADRNYALRDALTIIEEGSNRLGMIEQVGGTSVTGMKIAKAWRDGVLSRKRLLDATLDPTDTSSVRNLAVSNRLSKDYKLSSKDGVAPAAYERIYQLSGSMPSLTVIDWIKGSHATGWIDIAGLSAAKGSDELDAVFSESKILSKDRAWVSEQKNIYGAAVGTDARFNAIKAIEENSFVKIAEYYNVFEPDLIRNMYKVIDKRRSQVVDNYRSRAYGVDPDKGDLAIMTPLMRSQLETLMPMLNMRMMEKSAKLVAIKNKNADRMLNKSQNIAAAMLDEVMSLWKAGALIRLGYTARNTVEGWARSAVYLGGVPGADQLVSTAGRSVFNNAKRIEGKLPSFWRTDSTRLIGTKALMREEVRAKAKIDALKKEISDIGGSGNLEYATEIAAKEKSLDDLIKSLDNLAKRRENLGKRKYLGDDAAFGGYLNKEYGDLYRRLSSAERTNAKFLNSAYMRTTNDLVNSNAWGVVKPTDVQYWDELAGSAQQFRADEIAMRLLNGESIGDVVKWGKSGQARPYRRDYQIAKDRIEDKVVQIDDMITKYFPTAKSRELVRASQPTAAELRSALIRFNTKPSRPVAPKINVTKSPKQVAAAKKRYQEKLKKWEIEQKNAVGLSPIHGRQVADQFKPSAYTRIVDKPIEKVFKVLGTYPESTLVRHPFYNEVWKRSMSQQQKLAKNRGEEITEELLAKMNTSSHKSALRATNETLFTIERYSNPAAAMRWLSPFFAAWENSAKVWTRLVVNDPSVLARANMLWNIPEELGMIVDREGNKVEGSALDFLKGSQDQYLTLPSAMADSIQKASGGSSVRIPRGSLNVITPGETSWLPGFGPLVIYPVGKLLAGKPDVQKIFREAVGDQLYNQIAPFGNVNDDLLRNFVPTWLRQEYIRWRGTADENYVKTVNAMQQTAFVNWYKSGGLPEDKPDMDQVLQMANDFYRFTSIARLTLPVSTSRSSPYQLQVDAWNNMRSDPSMTYREKADSFISSYGKEFLPLTVSTSDATVPGIQSTQEVFKVITKHDALARELAETSPEAVGILASSAAPGIFDTGVYRWMSENNVPGLDSNYRGGKSPNDMMDDIVMSSAWRDYTLAKSQRDEFMAANGIKSLNSKAGAGVKKAWDDFKNQMVQKYQNEWVEEFNGWQNETASNLSAITKALSNDKFMKDVGSSSRWEGIKTYMDARQQAINAIESGAYDSARVREVFADWAAEYKYSSLEFNDFYERYLDQDELLRYGIGFLNG